MTKDELEQIATREAHCKPYGSSVTLSIGERDELVALAGDGMRCRWLREDRGIEGQTPFIAMRSTPLSFSRWIGKPADERIDAAMAEDEQ